MWHLQLRRWEAWATVTLLHSFDHLTLINQSNINSLIYLAQINVRWINLFTHCGCACVMTNMWSQRTASLSGVCVLLPLSDFWVSGLGLVSKCPYPLSYLTVPHKLLKFYKKIGIFACLTHESIKQTYYFKRRPKSLYLSLHVQKRKGSLRQGFSV